jgi:hypothetical protein
MAGTGTRFGLYLKEICNKGSPINVVLDLYSNSHPSNLHFAGYGAPQLGQNTTRSDIVCWHSQQGLIYFIPLTYVYIYLLINIFYHQ